MNPKKFRNSTGKLSETAETVAARCSTRHRHPRAAADEGSKTDGSGTSSSSLSSYAVVRATVTCNKGNNAQTVVDFNFSFCAGPFSGLLLCSGLLFFPSSSSSRFGSCGRSVGGRSCGCRRWERDNGGFVGTAGERRQAYLWSAEGRSWLGVCGERLEEGSLSGVGDGGAAAASGLPGLCGGWCALRLKKVGPTG